MSIEFASICIALCALFLTLLEATQSRKHRRLMCKPEICSSLSINEKQGSKTECSFTLENNGLGPARILGSEFFLDKKPCKLGGEYPITELCQRIFGEYEGFTITHNGWMPYGYMLPEKSEKLVIRFEVNGYSDKLHRSINETINRVNLIIYYESLYKEWDYFDSSEVTKPSLRPRPWRKLQQRIKRWIRFKTLNVSFH